MCSAPAKNRPQGQRAREPGAAADEEKSSGHKRSPCNNPPQSGPPKVCPCDDAQRIRQCSPQHGLVRRFEMERGWTGGFDSNFHKRPRVFCPISANLRRNSLRLARDPPAIAITSHKPTSVPIRSGEYLDYFRIANHSPTQNLVRCGMGARYWDATRVDLRLPLATALF